MIRKHVREKPHSRKQYNYTSTTFSDALQTHMMKQNGEKPYKFNQCDCTYAQAHKLQKHKMTHTGQKAHKYDHSFTCMWGLLGLIFSTESLPCLSISVSGWTFWNLKHCVKTSHFLLNDAMFCTMFLKKHCPTIFLMMFYKKQNIALTMPLTMLIAHH